MVGLSHDALEMWFNSTIQPVIEAYNKKFHLNISVSKHIIVK